ncbi:HNH endonuclease [Priestia aryabhattai]
MNAVELLNDMRRVQESISAKRVRRKNESRGDYIKRKAKYRCSYCHKTYQKKYLHTSLEPFHVVKKSEDLNYVLNYYRVDKKTLLKLNPGLKLKSVKAGTLLMVPDNYKIFPNTHGVCYCEKCKVKRSSLELDHVSFKRLLVKKRRKVRDKVTNVLRKKILQRDHYRCLYCEIEFDGMKINSRLTVDHKKPIVRGGTNTEDNLCTSCEFHNVEKDSDTFEEYIPKIKKRKFLRENGLVE